MHITQKKSITKMDIIIIIWGSGMGLFLIYHLTGYFIFRKKTLRWSRNTNNKDLVDTFNDMLKDMGIKKEITLLISKNISGPLVTGFTKPLLVLPNEDYSDIDLKFILHHELTHLKKHDIWYKLFLIFVNAVHWFNPFIYLLVHKASENLELSCDDSVLYGLSKDERKKYSEIIISVINMQKSTKTILSTDFYGGKNTMENRFANILNTDKKRNGIVLLIIVILMVFIFGGFINYNTNINNKLLINLGYTKDFLKDMYKNKTTFSDDSEKINHIISSLPLQSYRKYNTFSMQSEPLKEINISYEFDDNYFRGGNGLDPFPDVVEWNNALILFTFIKELDKINFYHYDNDELNYINSYIVDDLSMRFGDVNLSKVKFSDLKKILASNIQLSEFYFAHYSRIYLSVTPEAVSYRNGEPSEIIEKPDGSIVWIYPEFGKIYSISSESDNPEYTAVYYFNSPKAEKNDNLTGLYATRFIHAENFGKTYDDIVGVLGAPTIKKNINNSKKYIAYKLSDGNLRNAYFIFKDNKVIEEGVMYGEDYDILNLDVSSITN